MPAPAEDPPLSYPPAAAERVLRVALAEWRDWGGLVREAWSAGAAAAPEADPANFPRVVAYWRAVEQDHGAIPDNRRRYRAALAGQRSPGPALFAEPAWSAAFVSWVFRTAGVDGREFPPSATHALYLDALLADAARFPTLAPFRPHAPQDRPPSPGDLVCLDRGRPPLPHWTARLAEAGTIRPMHCDIVVSTAPGWVDAVGGNVLDAVAITRFPAGPDGRLLAALPGRPPILLVMESRLGRLPPWGDEGEMRR